jgi:anti-sigma factor RsiW
MKCREFYKKLDAYVCEEADADDRDSMGRHLETCRACRQLHRDYIRMCRQIRNLGIIRCPDAVVDKVYQEVAAKEAGAKKPSQSSLRRFFHWHWLRVGAPVMAALVVCLIAGHRLFEAPPPTSSHYSRTQIELADRQVKAVLASVGSHASRVQGIVRNDVLEDAVAKPLQSTVSKAMQPFWDGEEI